MKYSKEQIDTLKLAVTSASELVGHITMLDDDEYELFINSAAKEIVEMIHTLPPDLQDSVTKSLLDTPLGDVLDTDGVFEQVMVGYSDFEVSTIKMYIRDSSNKIEELLNA